MVMGWESKIFLAVQVATMGTRRKLSVSVNNCGVCGGVLKVVPHICVTLNAAACTCSGSALQALCITIFPMQHSYKSRLIILPQDGICRDNPKWNLHLTPSVWHLKFLLSPSVLSACWKIATVALAEPLQQRDRHYQARKQSYTFHHRLTFFAKAWFRPNRRHVSGPDKA